MEKTVRKFNLGEYDGVKEDLTYWLSKTPEERIAAVEFLRRQRHGNIGRLKRVIKVIKRS